MSFREFNRVIAKFCKVAGQGDPRTWVDDKGRYVARVGDIQLYGNAESRHISYRVKGGNYLRACV